MLVKLTPGGNLIKLFPLSGIYGAATFSIMTLSIIGLFATLGIVYTNDIQP
jgi:hypothetical protein